MTNFLSNGFTRSISLLSIKNFFANLKASNCKIKIVVLLLYQVLYIFNNTKCGNNKMKHQLAINAFFRLVSKKVLEVNVSGASSYNSIFDVQ